MQAAVELALGVEAHRVANDHVALVLLAEGHHLLEGRLGDDVVGVGEHEPRAARVLHAIVACVTKATIGLAMVLDVGIAQGIRARDVARVIGGAVVDEDDLHLLERLVDDRLDALGNVLADVVHGDDQRHHWVLDERDLGVELLSLCPRLKAVVHGVHVCPSFAWIVFGGVFPD